MYWNGELANTGSYGATPNPALYMPDQQWTLVALMISPTNLVIYINGKSATNTATRGPHDLATPCLILGRNEEYSVDQRRRD